MGWSVGYDTNWNRDIGYGVPAHCDHPGCGAEIDRGISYVCGGEPEGGEDGCGLFFCGEHRPGNLCGCCAKEALPFTPTPDHPVWVKHKLTDPSWKPWRHKYPTEVAKMRQALGDAA